VIWEADNEDCTNIQLCSKKIVEISNGWHIESVYFPDNKKDGKDFNYIGIVIQRNTREICKGCIHETKGPTYYCDECKRNWEDKYEKE
jgi:hypothetical protein